MCGSEAQLAFYSVDKRQASDRDRFGPAIIADRHAVLQTLFDPLAMRSLKVSQISKSAQLSQTLQVDDRVAFRRPLDLVESAPSTSQDDSQRRHEPCSNRCRPDSGSGSRRLRSLWHDSDLPRTLRAACVILLTSASPLTTHASRLSSYVLLCRARRSRTLPHS